MRKKTIVITGADGQLGRALCAEFGSSAEGLSRRELDLSRIETLVPRLLQWKPTAVINCAAYTQVDRAELDAEQCFLVNAVAVEALAEACRQSGSTLVQISTDYVFSASPGRTIPFSEEEVPQPQGVYARSKLAGELAARTCDQHLIVRTCGLFGVAGKNFVETMLRLGVERQALRVVDDQLCTPSYATHVARGIRFLLDSEQRGLFHVVNRGATTWHDFAAEIFRQARLSVRLERITTADYNAMAPRPAFSVLNTSRYDRLGGPSLATWQQALTEYLAAR